jgi:hypothetical protein
MVVQACNPSIQGAEVGGFYVWGQPELYSKNLSQKKKYILVQFYVFDTTCPDMVASTCYTFQASRMCRPHPGFHPQHWSKTNKQKKTSNWFLGSRQHTWLECTGWRADTRGQHCPLLFTERHNSLSDETKSQTERKELLRQRAYLFIVKSLGLTIKSFFLWFQNCWNYLESIRNGGLCWICSSKT